jgi:hypothetical protein
MVDMPPKLAHYATEAEYRHHYEQQYCHGTLYTFDGLRVFFPKHQFDDAFYESASRSARDKSVFSRTRAERIDWIRAAVQEKTAELYAGWNRDKKVIDSKRRVTVVYGDYVVILQVNAKRTKASFITAYVADAGTLAKIRSQPRWK